MKDEKENRLSDSDRILPRFRKINRSRIVKCLIMAVIVYLAFSYDLTWHQGSEQVNIYDRVIGILPGYGLPGNLFTLGLAIMLYLSFTGFGDSVLLQSGPLLSVAVVFGLLNAGAWQMFYRDSLPGSAKGFLLFLLQAGCGTVLFVIMANWLFQLFGRIRRSFGREYAGSRKILKTFEKHPFLFSFALILLCWAPWIISFYPASIEWDVYDPIMRYLGLRTPPSNHHPWFFTCIVGAAYQLGVKLGDRNIGMFLYIVLRGIAMAAIYAKCVALQKKNKVPFTVCFLTMLFFAVTPVWGAYAKHAFKDSIGAALFCWFICASIPVVLALRQRNLKPLPCLEFAAAGLLASLFRNNTVYVVLPVTFLIAVLALLRRQKIRSVLLLLCGVLLFEAYQGYIFRVAGVEKGSIREALSIPFQQTARTVRDHAEEITAEEKRTIGACLDYENLGTDYDPLISDPVKDGEHGTPSAQMAYLKTWVKMFFKYPYTYLEAFLAHSSGYYAFIPEFTEAQYFGNGSHVNIGMTVFNTVDDIRFPADFVCRYIPGLAGIREALAGWSYLWHEIPILNITDMKALYTWVIVLMGYAFIRRREYEKLIPVGACTLMVLTCIASPVNDCFRYYAPVAAAFPALFILLQEDGKP